MATPQYKAIAIDFLTESTAIPNVLLDHYREFNLSESELVFLLRLLRMKSCNMSLDLQNIEKRADYSKMEIGEFVCKLVDKGFLTVDKQGVISLNGLYDKYKEAWGWKQKRDLEAKEQEEHGEDARQIFGKLYKSFEQEMGRPLSSIEGEKIEDWFYKVQLPPDLIYEALKKAVLMGKFSFAYIDKIIMDWHRKKFQTLADVRKEEEQRGKKKNPKEQKSDVKYRKYQEEQSFDDIFEV